VNRAAHRARLRSLGPRIALVSTIRPPMSEAPESKAWPERARRWLAAPFLAAMLFSLGSLGGCSGGIAPLRMLLEFSVVPRSNQNAPVALSFVAVIDPKLVEKIEGMTAKQWFAQRSQMRRDYPGDDAFVEWEWEYVPGQTPPPVVIEIDGRATAAFLFANYSAPGDHRFRIGPFRRLWIEVGAEDVTIRPLEARAE
jgi:type VI secretion system protein